MENFARRISSVLGRLDLWGNATLSLKEMKRNEGGLGGTLESYGELCQKDFLSFRETRFMGKCHPFFKRDEKK